MLPDIPSALLGATVVPGEGTAGSGSVVLLLLYVGIALGVSFLCSVAEAVLLSSSMSHVQGLARQGTRAGTLMVRFKSNVERPISAILTLNTIAHTVGATMAGAEAVLLFGSALVGLISAVLTLLILVVSEIIPKTIGAVYWRRLIPAVAHLIQAMLAVTYPAVIVLELLGRLFRPAKSAPTVTRSDLEVMAAIGQAEGTLKERENRILHNLLQLAEVKVHEIMTPRTVTRALEASLTVEEAYRLSGGLPFTRLPVYRERIDEVVGYVLRGDILQALAGDRHHETIESLTRKIEGIPRSASVADALTMFADKREHILLVVDEYGGMAGILTMEDAFESLLGLEITDEKDVVADLRLLAQRRFERKSAQMIAAEQIRDVGRGR
jgi:CBS domain containing-hemolysin-like protein